MNARPLALAALLAAPLSAQSVPVRLGGGMSSFVGMAFDVPIEVDWSARADRMGSFALALRWDPALLRMDGGSTGNFGDVIANRDSAAQGVFKISGANPVGAAGLITLGVPRFTPLAAGTGTLQIELTELYAGGPTFPDVRAQAVVQNGLYCPARGYWGDPDLDRSAGSRDALLALSAAVGLDVSAFPEIGLADVDNDGLIRARDALITLSHAVGLDVSAFRIMRIAVGSCGSEATVTYSVAPDTGTVAVNQELLFLLSATTGTAGRTIPDVFWRSSNTGVLVVLSDGRAFSVGPGTATVTGKSGLKDSASATITVLARRPVHLVDAMAVGSPIRLGNSQYPFASIREASGAAQDGDTVLVQPGRYLEDAIFDRGVVVLGAAPGVRILGHADFATAITFFGSGTSEVRNVTIDSAYGGISSYGPFGGTPGRLRVTDVTMNDVQYAIQTDFTRTRVDNVTLTRGGTGIFVSGAGLDSVTNSTIKNFGYGVYGDDSVLYAAGNVIDSPIYNGILYYGQSTDSVVAVNNQVTCALGSTAYGIQVSDASLRAQGNAITSCAAGVYLSAFSAGTPLFAHMRSNTVALPATAGGAGVYVGGPFGAVVVGNTVTGGHPREGHGSIVLESFYPETLRLARVDSNIVQSAAVTGIRVSAAETTLVRGNLVEDVTGSDGSLFFFNHGALSVTAARDLLRIERNTLRRIHTRAGIVVNQNDTARVVMDSNAVSQADSAAVQVDAGVVSMTGNNIRNNLRYGLYVAAFSGAVHEVHGNAFVGNAVFGVQSDNDVVNAQQNWWGQATGACTAGADCANVNVDYANPLLADPPGLPPLAPRIAEPFTASRTPTATQTVTAPRPDREALVAAMRAERERLDALRLEQYRAYREALERRRAEYRSAQ